MDSAKLSDWMQVVGIFALIVSLAFVGLQMQQDRDIARAAIYQDRTAILYENLHAFASDRDRLEFKIKLDGRDPDELVSSDGWAKSLTYTQFYDFVIREYGNLYLLDNDHYQFETGFLSEDHWKTIRAGVKSEMSRNPMFRWVVEREIETKLELRPAFLNELQEIIREIDKGEST